MEFNELLHKLVYENPRSVSNEAIRLLTKIAENILKDPLNLKLRKLQKNNSTISVKLLSAKGSLECLKLMGFQERNASFEMPSNLSLTNLEKFRDSVIKWNNLTESEKLNLVQKKDHSINSTEKREPYIKQVKLPPLVLMYSNPFLRRIETYFHDILQIEDKDLQNRALKLLPVTKLEENAQKRLRVIQEHVKKNKMEDPDISIQDTLILELLNWFKEDFFCWVDSPECTYCSEKTQFSHMSTDPDLHVYTDRVELYRCTVCHKFTPFPRYNDINILLETRRGRCGEWAKTFTLFCRSMGWDSRFVVDEGDHVWTEVYSATQKRWLHCDPCENVCDTPLLYETGWNKKITYVIAYSATEVQDVTWRYCTNHKEVLKRRRNCSESELVNALLELRSRRQKNLSDARKQYLTKRLLSELVELLIEKKPGDNDKKGRSSGSVSWKLSRGEIQNELEDPLYVWQISGNDIVDNSIEIRYSTSLDKYQYISGGKVVKEVESWYNGVFKCSGVFRKEEKDWKMVYLARREGQDCGNISWKIELINATKYIDTISVNFPYTTYENGLANIQIYSEDKSLLEKNYCYISVPHLREEKEMYLGNMYNFLGNQVNLMTFHLV